MQKTYLYLMVCVIGAMSLASCSEDSISPDAGGDGDGDSTTEVPLAQVAKPKPNPCGKSSVSCPLKPSDSAPLC